MEGRVIHGGEGHSFPETINPDDAVETIKCRSFPEQLLADFIS